MEEIAAIEPLTYSAPYEAHDERTMRRLQAFVEVLSMRYHQGELRPQQVDTLYQQFGQDFLHHTLQGHSWRKPFGYAGDFLMIDKIYTYHRSDRPELRIWDEYFHRQAAPRAVRNRKDYLGSVVGNQLAGRTSVRLLNVASGPGRDLQEVYDRLAQPERLLTTCVEQDARAIAYAKALTNQYQPLIDFVHKNALRFSSQQRYDLIWSAGLFNYFDDRVFVRLLRRMKDQLAPGGEIAIGNFNENHNPSRTYMEVLGKWFLHHRTKQQLIMLAQQAGFSKPQIAVRQEPEGVNLFLHIRTDG